MNQYGEVIRQLEKEVPVDIGGGVHSVSAEVLTRVFAFVKHMPNRAIGPGRDAFQMAVSQVYWTMDLFPSENRPQVLVAISIWFAYREYLQFPYNHLHRPQFCAALHRIAALFKDKLIFTKLPEVDADLTLTWVLRQQLLELLPLEVVCSAFTAIRGVVKGFLELSFRRTLSCGDLMDDLRVQAAVVGMSPCFPILAPPVLESPFDPCSTISATLYWFELSAMQLVGIQDLVFCLTTSLAQEDHTQAQGQGSTRDRNMWLSVLREISQHHKLVMQRARHAEAILRGCGLTDAQRLYTRQVSQLIRNHFYAQRQRNPCIETMICSMS